MVIEVVEDYTPKNTITGFEKAIELGVDGIEIDWW